MARDEPQGDPTAKSPSGPRTIDELLALSGKDRAWLDERLEPILDQEQLKMLALALTAFLDFPRWQQAAQDPKVFNNRLNAGLRLIRRLMLMRFGLLHPRHRPTKHADRDEKIYVTRQQHTEWTFDAIGADHGLSATAARQAYERTARRKAEDLQAFKRYIDELAKEVGLPSPEWPDVP